jgi:hypothetical protein
MIHPVITPEYYKKYPLQPNEVVKALYLPCGKDAHPQIVTDTPTNAISLFFPDLKPKCLFFKDMFHIYVDPYMQLSKRHINYHITVFLRNCYRNNYGKESLDSITGDVLLFGTLNLLTNKIDGKDYSAPYHIIEEILRIHDIKSYF